MKIKSLYYITHKGNLPSILEHGIYCSDRVEGEKLQPIPTYKGVMGKGLALRAREQFPDVYVAYEKACRSKKITSARPYIYKREVSVRDELMDFKPHSVKIENPMKWFLLFATKRHWRANSRIEDIEDGLKWLEKNSKKEDIQSPAMPALGCALGKLNWADVAPLICKHLYDLGIPIEIYLPREYPIQPEYLTEKYLLAS